MLAKEKRRVTIASIRHKMLGKEGMNGLGLCERKEIKEWRSGVGNSGTSYQ